MKKNNLFYIFLLCCLIFIIFRNWFINPQIIGGDWPYIHQETLKDYSFYFSPWNPFEENGLGGVSPIYSLGIFHGSTVFIGKMLSLSWPTTYKIFWFGLFLFSSIYSITFLLKVVLSRTKVWQQILAVIIFCGNSYIIMVVSGGQMGVALAYSMAPLVLARFILLVNDKRSFWRMLQLAIIAAFALAAQTIFDPRIAYLLLISVGFYMLIAMVFLRGKHVFFFLTQTIFRCGLSIFFVILLNVFWLIPFFFIRSSDISQGITSVSGFVFLSFADFSHAFSMLHPNWPENIFGKTYFLKPEYLLLPVFAYSSILFLRKKTSVKQEQKTLLSIVFFCLIGLLGTFLAKGANLPFGNINVWLFDWVWGMNLFRDPTKFYLFIVLSYSVLIPFSVGKIYEWLVSKKRTMLGGIFLFFLMCYFLVLLYPAYSGQVGGTFKTHLVPREYISLKDFLHKQPGFFRTLWVPRQQRFAFYSINSRPMEAQPLFNGKKISDILTELHKAKTKEMLSNLNIRYIIVPYDPDGEIFVKDRKYDNVAYKKAIRQLEKISWLKRMPGFGRIAVFSVDEFKDHFFLTGKGKITYKMNNSTEYDIDFVVDQPQKIVFSENYNPYWVLAISGNQVKSEKTKDGLNSFKIKKQGKYSGRIIFLARQYYFFGGVVSGITMLTLVSYSIYYKKYLSLLKG